MKSTGLLLFLLLSIAALASGQQTPDGLQFNVPYLCSDGQTYVVHRCAVGPKGEFCYYQAEGQSERYNTRASVVYQMTKMCKVKAASSAPASATPQSSDLQLDTPYQCPGGLTLTAFECQRQKGQEYCFVKAEMNGKFMGQVPKPRSEIATQFKACKAGNTPNPPYLAEFPSPYQVVASLNVGDPRQNVARSIGAFYQLSEILKVLAGQRALTPDEQKLVSDYSRISGQLTEAGEKKYPGEKFSLATNPYRFSPSDPKFGFEGIPVWTSFLTPTIQAKFAELAGGNNPSYQQAVAQERRKAFQQVQDDADTARTEASLAKDPGSVAVRRCIESGRGELECLQEGMKVGFNDLSGGMVDQLAPKTPVGLRLAGVYHAGGATFFFGQEDVQFGCGSLANDIHFYTVENSGTQVQVKVANHPKPLVLSYKDGKLVGPGPVVVEGRVPMGKPVATTSTSYDTQTQTSTTQKQISAGEVGQYSADQVHQNGMEYSVDQQTTSSTTVPTQHTHYEQPMVPKTEHCNIGVVPATGLIPSSAASALAPLVGAKASQSANTTPGLRINGTYAASGGLKIEFREDAATLECGEALSSEAYSVVPEGGQLVVKFDNKTGPFALTLEPNGSLAGSGSIDVAGRQVIKSASGEITYRPRSARCSVGTLTAQAAH